MNQDEIAALKANPRSGRVKGGPLSVVLTVNGVPSRPEVVLSIP